MAEHRSSHCLIVIDVTDHVDTLKRVALLHGTFYRVLAGTRLIRILRVDHRAGHLEAIIETPREQPAVDGKVTVCYEPSP